MDVMVQQNPMDDGGKKAMSSHSAQWMRTNQASSAVVVCIELGVLSEFV